MTNPEPADLPISLLINGQRRELRVPPWLTLLDLLRERLDLVGSKKGCDHGQCGACTVLRNGRRINACLTLAVMCATAMHRLPSKVWPRVIACIPCNRRSSAMMPSSAATAPGQICSALGLASEGGALAGGDPRGHERQPVPLRRLRQYPRRCGRRLAAARSRRTGRAARMTPFAYAKPADIEQALGSRRPGVALHRRWHQPARPDEGKRCQAPATHRHHRPPLRDIRRTPTGGLLAGSPGQQRRNWL